MKQKDIRRELKRFRAERARFQACAEGSLAQIRALQEICEHPDAYATSHMGENCRDCPDCGACGAY